MIGRTSGNEASTKSNCLPYCLLISFSHFLDRGVRVAVSKIWLITGSSRGLGRALAESVLAAGEKLIATAKDVSQLDDLPRRFGDAVRLVPLDVIDQGAAMNAVDAAVSGF